MKIKFVYLHVGSLLTEKLDSDGKKVLKAQLVAKGYKEDSSNI